MNDSKGVDSRRSRGNATLRVGVLVLGLMLLIPILATTSSAVSGNWTVSYVDSENDVGQYSSIAVDSEGAVHISYYDDSVQNLMYANDTSGSWTVTVGDSAGDVGRYSSIAVDSSDHVHISYYDASNGALKYVTDSPGFWEPTTLDDGVETGTHTSIAVDPDQRVYISYRNETSGDLNCHIGSSGRDQIQVVDQEDEVGLFSSIAIGPDGNAHISYYDSTHTALKYARSQNELPDQPTELEAEPGDGSISLEWEAPQDEGSSPISGYNIYRGTSPLSLSLHDTVNDTDYLDGDMVNGHPYYYKVSAVNDQGEGELSDLISAIPGTGEDVPSTPQNLNATSEGLFVELTWDAPYDSGADDIDKYRVYRGTTSSSLDKYKTFEDEDVRSFNDTQVESGQTYYYKVSASNSKGWGPNSSEVSATPVRPITPSEPSEPLNLSTTTSGDRISLSWDAPEDTGGYSIDYYKVYRGTSSDSMTLLANNVASQQFNDTSVEEGEKYYYMVTAFNQEGEGDGAEVSATASGDSGSEGLPWLWIGIAVVAVIVAIVAILFLLYGGREKGPWE
ncbi:MAG: fibronectin type III domain-containing protein [Methanomassiliicoccales archaeon]